MQAIEKPVLAGALPGAMTGRASSPTAPGIARHRLRVLHVLDRIGVGGTELNVAKLMRVLPPETYEQRLCAVRGTPASAEQDWSAGPEPVFSGSNRNGVRLAVTWLARIMRRFRPDIVHSRNWGAIEAVAAARVARVPIAIHSEHGYDLDMFHGLPLRRRFFRRFTYGIADAVFAVSEELRDYHARQAWFSRDRIRVIYNGVDTDHFRPQPDLGMAWRKRLGLPLDAFVVGSVGRLVPIKDYPALLEAVKPLLARGIDARILLVGSGPELERLKALARISPLLAGKVLFAGLSHEIAQHLAAMDVFVLPSLREGMSNTLLEAMASGLAAIATRVGGNPEIVENGRSGILVPPGRPAEMAVQLERLARSSELRLELGASARERVLNRFTLGHMLAQYEKLYLELAGCRGIRTIA